MAVTRIKKVYLLALPDERVAVLQKLQKWGRVQIAPEALAPAEGSTPENSGPDRQQLAGEKRRLEESLSRLQWLIEHLEKVQPAKSMLENFLVPKELVDFGAFEQAGGFDLEPVYAAVQEIDEAEHQIQKQLRKNNHILQQLALFRGLPYDLEAFRDTQKIFVRLLLAETHELEALRTGAQEVLGEESVIDILQETKSRALLLVIGRREHGEAFAKWCENQPLEVAALAGLQGTADQIEARLHAENEKLSAQQGHLNARLQEQGRVLPQLQVFYDHLQNQLERYNQLASFLRSRFTAVITGWIRTRDIPDFEQLFANPGHTAGWLFEDPAPDENPPVDYDNPTLVKPFEFVTDLYSRPKYWELDPTPFLSAFFALFFGICLTDAGYGLTLVALSAFALKKFTNITPNSRNLLRILLFSGLVTTLVGIFTGGIFGVTPQQLPGPLAGLKHLVVLNPLQNQMGFLIFSLALGILHISLGIFLKFSWNLRHQQKADAWFDQAPWLAIILGVVTLAVAGQVQAQWLTRFGTVLLIVAALVILIFSGRAVKNPFVRFAQGFYSLYQVSGLLGDVLSYARLFALGLATGVIAGVVNFLAKMTLGIPYLGFVIMPLVLIGGHLLNIVINALGGFIHTSRLQYVEFFGKFYEGGGEPFEPFQLKLKYTKIKGQVQP